MKNEPKKNRGGRPKYKTDNPRKPRVNAQMPGADWPRRYGLIPQTGVTMFAARAGDQLEKLIVRLRQQNAWDIRAEPPGDFVADCDVMPWIGVSSEWILNWMSVVGRRGRAPFAVRLVAAGKPYSFAFLSPSVHASLENLAATCLELGVIALRTLIKNEAQGPNPKGGPGALPDSADAFHGLAAMVTAKDGVGSGDKAFWLFFDVCRAMRNRRYLRLRAKHPTKINPETGKYMEGFGPFLMVRSEVELQYANVNLVFRLACRRHDISLSGSVDTVETRLVRYAKRVHAAGEIRITNIAKILKKVPDAKT